MKIEKFQELESWKNSRELVRKIYSLTKSGQFEKDFGLKDQIQRASVSIMANISEGFDSNSNKSFLIFLNYAYRSASEVEALLYVALDLTYISQKDFDELRKNIKEIKNLIAGLKRYLMGATIHN